MRIRSFALTLALAFAGSACVTPQPDQDGPPPVRETVASTGPIDLTQIGNSQSCEGEVVERGGQTLMALEGGSLITMAPMAINVDGSGKAYHPDNAAGGAILHLCNAGQVYLPDGTRYHGSTSNSVCTGKFMDDVKRIGDAGWTDGDVGAVRWYGIVGRGSARVSGQTVPRAIPVLQSDGSGFYVSPTTLENGAFEESDQRRYVDALTVPHAVVRRDSGVNLGTFGVAIRLKGCGTGRKCDPVPFIVADIGPKIGEGSVALSRAVNGLPATTDIDRSNRFQGVVGGDDVLWIFFGGDKAPPPYSAASVAVRGKAAFEAWGGTDRLVRCQRQTIPVANAN
ncbi:hypothetical protein [Parvularcula sp. LCG005]|uniref:hypothetical protein n=1 Tax=Parvularcula sp. LCG005 TaxID=3078805 RepID=UPI002941D0B0|nr:hypothetical protein [Parvularcula sp. LCG005]WOI54749.1 hypothetical protein RUI03_07025 [Parvularcula sp. LCG005]